MPPPSEGALVIERAIQIRASPGRVLSAFFQPRDLAAWWGVSNAVTVARPLAPYAVQWPPTHYTDEVLGQLGGTLHGTVMDIRISFSESMDKPRVPVIIELLGRRVRGDRKSTRQNSSHPLKSRMPSSA